MTLILIAIFAFVLTYAGGEFAKKIKDRKHLLTAFSAGTILAVSLFDLLPESIELISSNVAMICVAIGFGLYFLLNNYFAITAHKENDVCHNDSHHHHHNFNMYGLILHSLFDGLFIGFSYQASPALGLGVAVGVLTHRLADGINTVVMSDSMKWLHLNAAAPVLGILAGSFISIPNNILGIILGVSAGIFLYISASDLVPECHHDHPKFTTGVSFVLGLSILWGIIQFAHEGGHGHSHNAPLEHGHQH